MKRDKYILVKIRNYRDFVSALEKEKSVVGSKGFRINKLQSFSWSLCRQIGCYLKGVIKAQGANVLCKGHIDNVSAETSDWVYKFSIIDVTCKNKVLTVHLYFRESISKT